MADAPPLFHYEVDNLNDIALLFAEWAKRDAAAADTDNGYERVVRAAEARAWTIAAAVLYRTKLRSET